MHIVRELAIVFNKLIVYCQFCKQIQCNYEQLISSFSHCDVFKQRERNPES